MNLKETIRKVLKEEVNDTEYAVIEILRPSSRMPQKWYFQAVPLNKTEQDKIYIKRGPAGILTISTKNIKIHKTFKNSEKEEMDKYLEKLRDEDKKKGEQTEGLHDTSWENDGDKVTLVDLLKATEDIPVKNISVEKLKPNLLSWDEDEEIVTQYIKDNYIKYFNKEWRERECDEDEDTINENKGEIEKDLSPIITELLDKIIVVNTEDVCKIEVTAPWNRETISGGDYRNYAVKVYFIGGPKTKNWPRTMGVVLKEDIIMEEIWTTVKNFMGISTDVYSKTVKKCDEDINESVEDNKKERSDIERYILRRVPWNEILEGLDDGIKWAERRCQRYEDINLERFSNMVMSVLMDNILLFLKDEVSQEIIHYGATENYLRNLFSDEIRKSYNRLIN